jgi:hypothetical protein
MFEFTAADLQANRRGQLSPGQRGWLKGVALGGRGYSWINSLIAIGFAFLGLCIVFGLSLQNERSRAALFSNPMNLIVLIGSVPLVMGIMGLAMFLNYRNANKLENAVLSTASGPVRFDEDSSGESGITTYYVVAGKKKFKFAEDMSRVFKEGEKYKFYYCKAGMYEFVMSYEPMRENNHEQRI